MRRLEEALVLSLIGLGCGGGESGLPGDAGGGDGGPADGTGDTKTDAGAGAPVPGGGVSGGAIAGVVNVYVLETSNDAPIKGAFVQVGETASTARSGMTDDTGFVAISDASLTGPQTITAGKTTYRTATVTDLAVSNITMTLAPVKTPPLDTAKVRGTVDWNSLAPVAPGHYRLAYVSYALSERLGSPRDSIVQGTSGPMIPDNLYAPDLPLIGKKEFATIVPTGAVDLFALVIDADTNGEPLNPNAWILTQTHVGLLDGLSFAKGEDKGGQTVPVVAATDQLLRITVPDLPMGMVNRGFFAVIRRGKDRIMPLFPDVDPAVGIPAPKLEGPFLGANLWAVASTDDAPDAMTPATKNALSIQRGITSYAMPAAPPPFLPAIGSPRWSLGEIFYAAVPGASIHNFDIAPKGSPAVWGVTVLDKTRAKIHLPELPAGAPIETVPSGDLDLGGQALALPGFDAMKATFRDFEGIASGLSEITFAGKK